MQRRPGRSRPGRRTGYIAVNQPAVRLSSAPGTACSWRPWLSRSTRTGASGSCPASAPPLGDGDRERAQQHVLDCGVERAGHPGEQFPVWSSGSSSALISPAPAWVSRDRSSAGPPGRRRTPVAPVLRVPPRYPGSFASSASAAPTAATSARRRRRGALVRRPPGPVRGCRQLTRVDDEVVGDEDQQSVAVRAPVEPDRLEHPAVGGRQSVPRGMRRLGDAARDSAGSPRPGRTGAGQQVGRRPRNRGSGDGHPSSRGGRAAAARRGGRAPSAGRADSRSKSGPAGTVTTTDWLNVVTAQARVRRAGPSSGWSATAPVAACSSARSAAGFAAPPGAADCGEQGTVWCSKTSRTDRASPRHGPGRPAGWT